MPLLDHFHAPIYPRRAWESFHGSWCNGIMWQLNRMLRPRFYADFQVHLGARIEADVAEFDCDPDGVLVQGNGEGGEGGVAVATWAPPKATCTIDALFPDDIEVRVIDTRDGATLVAVIELVSPGNKDRPDKREAFASRCAAYLQRGLGLIVVDVVTARQANLHNALLDLLRQPGGRLTEDSSLYATAYRPVHRQERNQIDIWIAQLALGQPLPTLPLALRGFGCVPVDLETAYARARDDSGL
jgi:hypothetical protein